MPLPDQLLLSDLLRRRVRTDQGLDQGPGVLAWMHPPVHRLLGWVSRPSAFDTRRLVWRLNQWRGFTETEVLVKGDAAITDLATLDRLPTLIQASLLGRGDEPLGTVVDAAVHRATGAIQHYLVSRSDPRLPGSSRWRLTPDRIEDQRPGAVLTAIHDLDDLPLERASVRQELLRRSRRWRDQVQDLGGRFEQRVEGWLEEPSWPDPRPQPPGSEPWEQDDWPQRAWDEPPRRRAQGTRGGEPEPGDDPWI